jgi:CheY-like chemotaxis protein
MKTILVVDDEFGIVEVLVLALEDEGYRVLAAADGERGLERLAEQRPDLVLLDVMMPLMDGPAMADALRRRYGNEIPLVVMSSVSEESVRERIDGYAAFLRKPFRVRAVLEVVARVIGRADPQDGEEC